MYRTGDLGKYLPDGNLLFLGREDSQVKVNGFRIELSEIEATIKSHEDIKECNVQPISTAETTKIIAYIVPGDFTPTDTEIKEFLQKKLPYYMIPSIFIFMSNIPLTINGKVDKSNLPVPEILKPYPILQTWHAACLPLEQQLKDVWMEVLRISSLNIDDNFYRIGGDSIISLQMVAKARQKGIHFRVQDLFAHPTIRALAQVVNLAKEEKVQLEQFDTDIIPLSPIQLWFFHHDFNDKNHFNQAVVLKSIRQIELQKLQHALQVTVSHHPALQFSFFQNSSGVWYQKTNTAEKTVVLEVIELPATSNEEAERDIATHSTKVQQTFNITTGDLVNVIMFHVPHTSTQYLLIVIHHLVVDTVSWRILVEDLEHSYTQLLEGNTTITLPVSSSYQYWVQNLLHYSNTAEMELERNYWRDVESQITLLAEDFKRGPLSYCHMDTVRVSLDQHDTLSLLHHVNHAYRTQINDILLTALVLAIGDLKGEYRLSFCLEGHGREEHIAADVDLSHTVGWFTSLFAMNLLIDHPSNLELAIKQVKESLHRIPKKGIGYGLMYYHRQQPFFHASTRPNIIFNYLGQWDNRQSEQSIFSFTNHLINECASKTNAPFFPIEVNAEIKQNVLTILWGYSTNHFASHTVESIGQYFISRLKQLISHCKDNTHFGYTPTDFPLVDLSQKEIDENLGALKDVEDIYPLSPMQFGILFHHLYAPHSNNYFVQTVFKINGIIDKDALQRASTQLAAHNQILRTGFMYEGLSKPVQYVLKEVTIDIHYEDWSRNAEDQHQTRIDAFLRNDQAKGFNLSHPPLFRIALIKIAHNRFILCFSQHHILLDGWSSSLLLNEFFDRYSMIRQNLTNYYISSRPLFKQYIAWQQRKQSQDSVAKDFWRHYLYSLEDVTHLDFKDLIHETEEAPHNQSSIKLSYEEAAHLTQFAEHHQYTINTVVLAAVALTLKNYMPYQELVLGVTVSGRDPELPGVEDMIGLLINTLPLRVPYDPTTSITTFLQTLQETILNIQKYSYLPLAEVQSHAPTDRNLFNVIFVFEKHLIDTTSKTRYADFSIEEFIGIENTEYPLTITLLQGDRLELIFNYQTSLFSKPFITRILQNILHILKQIRQLPHQIIQSIDGLTLEEKQRVGIEWSGSKHIEPLNNTLNELYEAQTELTPNNTAIICKGESFSYTQLNIKANQLAHYLRSQNVSKETRVVIFCERSFEMMIAILATLKAGGTYIPVDPHYPQETLSHILADSQAEVLLTQMHLMQTLPKMQAEVIDIGIHEALTYPENNLSLEHDAHTLAYIIYTSGSTGKPKGVMIEHGNVCKRLIGYQDFFPLTTLDRVLCQTSISFDVFLAEVFWPFSVGGTVVVSTGKGTEHLLELENLIYTHQVTFVQFVPSVLKLFLIHIDPTKKYHLRGICSGGEILEYKLVEECSLKLPDIKLLNAYGPTETTIDTTILDCSAIGAIKPMFVPIGRSLSNSYAYVVNPFMQLVPIGVVGELCIGGASVARGYLNQPDMTLKSFVTNPFLDFHTSGKLPQLYKTGDLCRWSESGHLEYIGRKDNQVKIRGFRVELHEVEEALLRHPAIKDAVVVVKQDKAKNKQLVAYLVLLEEKVEVKGIREWLKNLLPDHMVPNDFIYLDYMPLNANGKVDRKKIAQIKTTVSEREYVLPTTQLEQSLCEIWKRILHLDAVGIRDNFFFLGGNSILATQLILHVKREFQQSNISFAAFFNEPTVENLAKLLSDETLSHTQTNVLNAILKDIATASAIVPTNNLKPAPLKRHILLTGASGFLGAHLLKELLQQTDGRIYCLLRGTDISLTKQQFQEKLSYYQLEHLSNNARVILVLGNIAEPHLGLDDSTYRFLTTEVTDIYHNGALVHHIFDYIRLQSVNVHSTIEILKLASSGIPKLIHYISTLSATMDKNAEGQILEDFVKELPVGNEGGYSLSKWTSEKILANAVTRGFQCTVHRLPQIMGHSVTGITPNDQTHITLLMKHWIELGIAPKNMGNFEFLPVDFTAKAIVAICQNQQKPYNHVYNYGHPTVVSFNQIIEWLNAFEYPITLVDKNEWQQRCASHIQEDSALYPLLSLYLDSHTDIQEEKEANHRTGYRKDNVIMQRYLTVLEQKHIDLPDINEKLFFKYCQYLQSWFKV